MSRLSPASLLLAAPLFVACGAEPPDPEPVIRPVRSVVVRGAGGDRIRSFSGVAAAGSQQNLSFRVAGSIARVAVRVGRSVAAGDRIAELDPMDYLLRVREAEAALAQREAEARNAAANLERIRGLYENRNASRNELDAARAAAESAAAARAAAEQQLAQAQRQLGYTRLVAPAAGAIASVPAEVNENVSAGQTVALLSSGDHIEVEVAIPEDLIAQMREDDDASVSFASVPGEAFPATVTEVGVSTVGAATFPVTVRLDSKPRSLRPGMAADVSFRFPGSGSESLVVPTVAVGEDRRGRYVFVVEPAENGLGTSRRRAVTVGEITPEGLEILDGLRGGEIVVTAGVRRIRDGLTVRVETESPGP